MLWQDTLYFSGEKSLLTNALKLVHIKERSHREGNLQSVQLLGRQHRHSIQFQQHPIRADPSESTIQTELIIMFQKRKSCMLHHSHHSFNTKSLQCWNLKHQWHYNRTGTWMHRRCSLKFLEHKKDKLEVDMQRECMASDNPEGQKGKKNCWQHCMDRFAQLACASFQLAAGPFSLGRRDPDLFSCGNRQTLFLLKDKASGKS